MTLPPPIPAARATRPYALPVVALFQILLALAFPLRAGDWTQFRGPRGTGASDETSIPIHWQTDKHFAWKINLPGRGLSSPIIVGDRAFLTCSSGPRQEQLHVLCFSTRDGALLWERRFWATGRTMTHEKTCVAAPTPATDGQRLFALFSSNDLLCLDLDGNLLWTRGLTRDYPNASNSLGMASSPVVVGNTLVIQIENDSESFAAGLDAVTGQNRWKKDRPKSANWTSPQIVPDSRTGLSLVALQSGAGIHALDPATGHEAWYYGDGASTIPSSAAHKELLFVPSHGLTALKPGRESASPEQLWRSSQLRPGTASPLVREDRVYVLNDAGVLNCGDARTGGRLWQLRLKGPFSASPVAAQHVLFCVNEKGIVQIIDGAAPEGAVLSEFDLADTVIATPSIARGALYIRTDKLLWKISDPTPTL